MTKKKTQKSEELSENSDILNPMIVVYALRYALGRTEFLGTELIDWMIENLPKFSCDLRNKLIDECEHAWDIGRIYSFKERENWERFLLYARKGMKIV